jgi:hypothetical protein
MEISRLFQGLTKEKPQKKYLIIKLKDKSVETAVLAIENNLPKITATGPELPYSDENSLVEAVDGSLEQASSKDSQEVNDAIFSIPEYWIQDQKVKGEEAKKLKHLIGELKLTPTGYVATTDAILNYLRHTEGTPPNVILVDVGGGVITIMVAKKGKTEGLTHISRSSDLAIDIEEGLSKLGIVQLPSRILLFNDYDPETSLKLNSHAWSSNLDFMHLPKVETLAKDFCITAIAVTGGIEAAAKLGISIVLPKDNPPKEEEPVEIPTPTAPVADTMIDTDEPLPPHDDIGQDDFGFVTDQDIRNINTVSPSMQSHVLDTISGHAAASDLTPKSSKEPPLPTPPPKTTKLPAFKLPKLQASPKFAIFAILPLVIFGLISIGGYFLYQSRGQAEITIEVAGQKLNKNFRFAVGDAKASGLVSIPGELDKIEIEKTDQVGTTGEAIVGEKATGEVTLFNKTDTARTLKAGTVLSTTTSQKFVLDETTTVASRSAEEKDGGMSITFGQVKAKVTAQKIGADHNIESNVTLSVADYPKTNLEAKTLKSFSGGSSRTVKAVSKKDRDDLIAKLSEVIKAQAKQELEKRTQDLQVYPVGELKITKQSFNKGVDEEADNLSLTMKAEVTLVKFNKEGVKQIIKTQLGPEIPAGFIADLDRINFRVDSIKQENDVLIASTSVESRLTPQIDYNKYKSIVKGARVDDLKQYFENIAGYKGLDVEIRQGLPFFKRFIPNSEENIKISVNTQL